MSWQHSIRIRLTHQAIDSSQTLRKCGGCDTLEGQIWFPVIQLPAFDGSSKRRALRVWSVNVVWFLRRGR
jgi:hypothetical protein